MVSVAACGDGSPRMGGGGGSPEVDATRNIASIICRTLRRLPPTLADDEEMHERPAPIAGRL